MKTLIVALMAGALFVLSGCSDPTPPDPAPVSTPAPASSPAPWTPPTDVPAETGGGGPSDAEVSEDGQARAEEMLRRLEELQHQGPGDPEFDCLASGRLYEDCQN